MNKLANDTREHELNECEAALGGRLSSHIFESGTCAITSNFGRIFTEYHFLTSDHNHRCKPGLVTPNLSVHSTKMANNKYTDK